MRKGFFLFFSFLLISFTLFSQQQLLDSLFSTVHNRGFYNGNVLILRNDSIVYQKSFGYAKADKSELLKPKHRFGIGSIAKQFDGIAIMQLVEQGLLTPESKISQHIKGLPKWADDISVLHLLQYTSGLPTLTRAGDLTNKIMWDYLVNLDSLNFSPGTDYLYNNTNTFLRRLLIEEISQRSYSEYIQKNLLDKAGMNSTYIDARNERFLAQDFDASFQSFPQTEYLSGWIYPTAHDFYQWTKSVFKYELISKESVNSLLKSFENKHQSTLGHSVVKNDTLLMQWHHGLNGNYEALSYYNPIDDYIVILLCNSRNSNLGDLTTNADAILRGEDFQIPKKEIDIVFQSIIRKEGVTAGLSWFQKIKNEKNHIYDFDKEIYAISETAEYLLIHEENSKALQLLEWANTAYDNTEIKIMLAEAYLKNRQIKESISAYRALLEQYPEDDRIKEGLYALTKMKKGK